MGYTAKIINYMGGREVNFVFPPNCIEGMDFGILTLESSSDIDGKKQKKLERSKGEKENLSASHLLTYGASVLRIDDRMGE